MQKEEDLTHFEAYDIHLSSHLIIVPIS